MSASIKKEEVAIGDKFTIYKKDFGDAWPFAPFKQRLVTVKHVNEADDEVTIQRGKQEEFSITLGALRLGRKEAPKSVVSSNSSVAQAHDLTGRHGDIGEEPGPT